MSQYSATIKKLQKAINDKYDEHLLYNRTQFFSEQAHKPITFLSVKKAVFDEDKGRTVNVEMFSSTSEIQIVLWLRDYWYELNGWEVPTDNQIWEDAKRKYAEKHNKNLDE